jgi:hypothetical protein
MAITKTSKLLEVIVHPATDESPEPVVTIVMQDSWDDPEDELLPVAKKRTETRGRAYDPEVPDLKTPLDDWPQLAQDIAKKVWRY